MRYLTPILLVIVLLVPASSRGQAPTMIPVPDPRHLSNGLPVPGRSYCDQPYIVRTDDGGWLCVMTSGGGAEGAAGQNIFAMRSMDQGKTWTEPVPVEPPGGPEASYAVLLKTP